MQQRGVFNGKPHAHDRPAEGGDGLMPDGRLSGSRVKALNRAGRRVYPVLRGFFRGGVMAAVSAVVRRRSDGRQGRDGEGQGQGHG